MKFILALFAVALSVTDALPRKTVGFSTNLQSAFPLREIDDEHEAHNFEPVGQCPPVNGLYPELLPDSGNSSIYYVCESGVPIMMSCPPYLVFDPDLKVCAHESRQLPVGECPPVDGEFPTFLENLNDKKIYYECRSGEPKQMVCPGDLEFNPKKKVCDWPRKPNQAVGECPKTDPEVPVILPDSDDCSVYYVCYDGQPFKGICPEDLLFNPERNYCDFPQNVNCTDASTEDYH